MLRNVIVVVAALVIAIGSVVLAVQYLGAPWIGFEFESPIVDYICTAIGVVIAAVVIGFGVKYKNYLAVGLAVVQVADTGLYVWLIGRNSLDFNTMERLQNSRKRAVRHLQGLDDLANRSETEKVAFGRILDRNVILRHGA